MQLQAAQIILPRWMWDYSLLFTINITQDSQKILRAFFAEFEYNIEIRYNIFISWDVYIAGVQFLRSNGRFRLVQKL